MREYQGDTAALGGVFTEQPQTVGMVVVTVVVTLVGLFGLVLLVGITWCCCAKNKDLDTEEDNEESSGFIARKSGDAQGSSRRGDGDGDVSIPVEGMWGNDKNGNQKARGSVQGRHRGAEKKTSEDNAISVKDRVQKFERKSPADSDIVVNKRDGSKPGKKKPRSKAFEEFESSGIIIGMGNAPRKRQSDIDWEADDNGMEEQEGRGSSFEYLPTDPSPLYPRSTGVESGRLMGDEEGGSTKEYDEDVFAGVERNTEILKSFRRAPPPRKHNKPRRKPLSQQAAPSGDLWDTPSKMKQSKTSDTSVTCDVSCASNSVSQPPPTRNTDHSDTHGSGVVTCELWKMNHDHMDNHNMNDVDEHDYVYRAERTQKAHTTAAVSRHTDRWTSSHATNFKCPNDLAMDTTMDKVSGKVLLDDGYRPLQNNVQQLSDCPQSCHYGANNEMSAKETKVFSLSHNNDITPTLTCYDTKPSPKSGTHENTAATSLDNTDNSADYHKWHRHRSGSEKARQPLEGAGSSSSFNNSGADMRKWQSEHLDYQQRPLSESSSTRVWHMQQPGMHRDTSKQLTPADQTISQSVQQSAARISPTRQHSAPVGPSSASIKYLETEI